MPINAFSNPQMIFVLPMKISIGAPSTRVMDDGSIRKPRDVVDANLLAVSDRLTSPCLKLFDPQPGVVFGTSRAAFPTLKPGIIGPRVSGRRLAR
jgi:hypothetical protein